VSQRVCSTDLPGWAFCLSGKAGHLPLPSDLVRPNQTAYQLGMAKRVKQLPQDRGTVLFDVVFEDGSRASNRRVPMEILGGLDGDQPARQLIEQQEMEIAEKAGRPPRSIQSLVRAAKPEPKLVRE
jgi:hypothetical protein